MKTLGTEGTPRMWDAEIRKRGSKKLDYEVVRPKGKVLGGRNSLLLEAPGERPEEKTGQVCHEIRRVLLYTTKDVGTREATAPGKLQLYQGRGMNNSGGRDAIKERKVKARNPHHSWTS